MASIKHLLHIDASREEVYDALTSIHGLAGWWTTQASGDTNEGGTLQFRFGQLGNNMKVLERKKDQLVKWECVAGPPDWLGTTVSFYLDDNDNKTRVRFEHAGWQDNGDFYAACSFSWGKYLESLRQLCQTGMGEAFGSEGYRR